LNLIKLANDALTKVRRRVTWDLRQRRGRKLDPEWANRRRLLTARERLSEKSFAKMWNQISAEDPSSQILSAWIAKEELRNSVPSARNVTVTYWGHASFPWLTGPWGTGGRLARSRDSVISSGHPRRASLRARRAQPSHGSRSTLSR